MMYNAKTLPSRLLCNWLKANRLMLTELRISSIDINLLAFSQLHNNLDGNVFALYIIAVAAAEVGVGLAMVLLIYRNRKSISLDELSEMKG